MIVAVSEKENILELILPGSSCESCQERTKIGKNSQLVRRSTRRKLSSFI
jgi:hypothetical protein